MVQAHDILMDKMELEGCENEEEFDEVCRRVSCLVHGRRVPWSVAGLEQVISFYVVLPSGVSATFEVIGSCIPLVPCPVRSCSDRSEIA